MKIRLIEKDLDEVFFDNEQNLLNHYNKHVLSGSDGTKQLPNMTKDDYNNLADKLSSSPCGSISDKSAQVVGYETVSGRRIKFDKSSGYVVVYVDDDVRGHTAIALYKQTPKKFFFRANGTDPKYAFYKDLTK